MPAGFAYCRERFMATKAGSPLSQSAGHFSPQSGHAYRSFALFVSAIPSSQACGGRAHRHCFLTLQLSIDFHTTASTFNNETTAAHCSLPMLKCPGDEVGPSSRCCAELAPPPPPHPPPPPKQAHACTHMRTHTPARTNTNTNTFFATIRSIVCRLLASTAYAKANAKAVARAVTWSRMLLWL